MNRHVEEGVRYNGKTKPNGSVSEKCLLYRDCSISYDLLMLSQCRAARVSDIRNIMFFVVSDAYFRSTIIFVFIYQF